MWPLNSENRSTCMACARAWAFKECIETTLVVHALRIRMSGTHDDHDASSAAQVRTWQGVEYVDITEAYFSLPRTRIVETDRWVRRLEALKIPIAVCRLTRQGDFEAVAARNHAYKRVWVPSGIWSAIVRGEAITYDDIPTVPDLVRPDGYVDLSKLCSLAFRRADDILKSKPVQSFISALEVETNMDVIQREEGYLCWKIWVHPRLADYVSFGGSVQFAIKATAWIDSAKQRIPGLRNDHLQAIHEVARENAAYQPPERSVRDRLRTIVGGDVEVVSNGTRSDIVTDTSVIEVKHAKNRTAVAHAIGQVSLYNKLLRKREKRVHLFGTESEIERCENDAELRELANDCDVRLTFESV